MASQGPNLPSSGTSVDRAGATAWTTPGNITADDTNYASAAVPTDYLIATGFGFSIPAGATINGVSVQVEAYETGSGSSNFVPQLCSDGTPTLIGTAKTATTVNAGSSATPNVYDLGGVADLWGATLTPTIVNGTGFGVVLWSTDTTNTLFVNVVRITIEYTPASTTYTAPTPTGGLTVSGAAPTLESASWTVVFSGGLAVSGIGATSKVSVMSATGSGGLAVS